MSGTIQVPSSRSAQPRITPAKSRSTVTVKRPERIVRRRRRGTCRPSSSKTARGSGDHQQTGSPSLYHGKMPCRYASSSQSGRRSPPRATRPMSSANSGRSKGLAIWRNQRNTALFLQFLQQLLGLLARLGARVLLDNFFVALLGLLGQAVGGQLLGHAQPGRGVLLRLLGLVLRLGLGLVPALLRLLRLGGRLRLDRVAAELALLDDEPAVVALVPPLPLADDVTQVGLPEHLVEDFLERLVGRLAGDGRVVGDAAGIIDPDAQVFDLPLDLLRRLLQRRLVEIDRHLGLELLPGGGGGGGVLGLGG